MTLTVYSNPATEPRAREFSDAIEVPANATWLMLSGIGPGVVDPAAASDTEAAYGDTYIQTRNVLQQAQAKLQARGYGLGDVVRVVGLVVAGANGEPDFAGFSRAWNEVFGTAEQPHIPVRTRSQVARLVPPGWLVEVEISTARVK